MCHICQRIWVSFSNLRLTTPPGEKVAGVTVVALEAGRNLQRHLCPLFSAPVLVLLLFASSKNQRGDDITSCVKQFVSVEINHQRPKHQPYHQATIGADGVTKTDEKHCWRLHQLHHCLVLTALVLGWTGAWGDWCLVLAGAHLPLIVCATKGPSSRTPASFIMTHCLICQIPSFNCFINFII